MNSLTLYLVLMILTASVLFSVLWVRAERRQR